VRLRTVVAGAVACALLAGGCSGGSAGSAPSQDPTAALLARARSTLDQLTSVHFTLTSADVPPGGTRLLGGEGFAARPQAFKGTLDLLFGGAKASIEVVSVDGKVYVKAPFTSGFAVADPVALGLKDPAVLVDRRNGIARLLSSLTGARSGGQTRVNGEVLREVSGSIPGEVVADLLTDADPSAPVAATLFIAEGTGQLRRAVLTGPFFVAGRNSTYTLVLDRYDERVQISAPPIG